MPGKKKKYNARFPPVSRLWLPLLALWQELFLFAPNPMSCPPYLVIPKQLPLNPLFPPGENQENNAE